MAADHPAPTRLVVVRHGETAWNAARRMQGQLDVPLSARGLWQADRTGAALASTGIEAIFASDLSRARTTAEALASRIGLPVALDAGLRERTFGVFEGHTYAEIDVRWPAEAVRWHRHEPAFGPSGGETLIDFDARSMTALTRIARANAGRHVAVFTHGGVLDCLYRAATRCGLDAPRTWQLGNCSINRVLWSGAGFTLVGWDDVGHLADEPVLDDTSEG